MGQSAPGGTFRGVAKLKAYAGRMSEKEGPKKRS